jgi:hypothetical protein
MYFLSPCQDDSDMTLQVALAGRDGFVIASDTKAISGTGASAFPGAGTRNIRRSSSVRKILVAVNGGLVCAFSGDELSMAIAQKLVDSCPGQFNTDAEVREHLQRSAVFAQELGLNPDKQLIIAAIPNAAPPVSKLWRVYFVPGPTVMAVRNRVVGGDESNSAIYIVERYHNVTCSVKELQVLAAHTIREGHYLNAITVDGLDVLVAKDGTAPRFLEEIELADLAKRSDSIHDEVSRLFVPS